jgi:hypothetical protein
VEWITRYSSELTAFAAILAAFAAIYAAHIAARSQISAVRSGLRVKWIEDMRQDVSELLAYGMLKATQKLGEEDRERVLNTKVVLSRVQMRINPEQSEHVELQKLLTDALSAQSLEEHNLTQVEVIVLARKIFKAEWKRAAKGE